MKYKVMVEWVVCTTVEIEADSVEDAIQKVESDDSLIPTEGSYLDGSLTINQEITYQLNSKNYC